MFRNHTVREAGAGPDRKDPSRRAALVAGLLFIIADIGTFAGDAFLRTFAGPDYLTQLYAHADLAAAGVLAKLVAALAGAGIAVAMYQVLRRAGTGAALGSVVFRTLEAAFYTVGSMSLLVLLKLSQQFAVAGVSDRASLRAIADTLLNLRSYAAPLLGVFAFCIGGFLYNLLFFRARLVPRWLSGFGIVAILALATACALSLFSGNPITSYIPLAFPIFVQELMLATWLLAKGFDTSAIGAEPMPEHADLPLTAASSVAAGAR